MSDLSELSISFSPFNSNSSLNETKDLLEFYAKNNVTLSALEATYDLVGKKSRNIT